MKASWLVIAAVVLVAVAVGPAAARSKQRAVQPQCVDRPYQFSLERMLRGPGPQPNGCSPPVYQFNRFVGQDPDPNIRFQLRRDPATGYTSDLQN